MSLLSVPSYAGPYLGCNLCSSCSYGSARWPQFSERCVLLRRRWLKESEQAWTPVLCVGSARPTLDDVERLSRGRPSKAKIGSRAVPHRLNADERKAYELAKKRGFVVHQPSTRRYPLINSHRNYCDALDIPCIRIDQGPGGSQADQVVIDLTTLRRSEVDLKSFKEVVTNSVESALSQKIQTSLTFVGEETDQTSDVAQSKVQLTDIESSVTAEETLEDIKLLRFEASSRSEAKLIAQTCVDAWKSWSGSNVKIPA